MALVLQALVLLPLKGLSSWTRWTPVQFTGVVKEIRQSVMVRTNLVVYLSHDSIRTR